MNQGPHSDVKLAALIQKRPLNILLDDPLRVLWLLLQILLYVSDLREELDTPALVERRWLENPLVVLTVLVWDIFSNAHPLTDMDI